MLIEKGNGGFWNNLKAIPKNLNAKNVTAGILSIIFGLTGPLILVTTGNAGNYSRLQIAAWMFSANFFGGVISVVLALRYKMPINGAWSIPGAALIAGVITNYSVNELFGACVVSAVIVLALGLSGVIKKIMKFLPNEIVMAMIVGCMMHFATSMIASIEASWLICGLVLLSYLLFIRFLPKVPGLLGALVVGVIAFLIFGKPDFSGVQLTVTGPMFVAPAFNIHAIVSISIPLALIVIGSENAQAIGCLVASGYDPPVNMMTIITGVGGIAAALFGGHNANIAGPMTAICCSDEAGDPNKRYVGTIINSLYMFFLAFFAYTIVSLIGSLPTNLISALVGLAIANVLIRGLQAAFSSPKFRLGSFFALIVGLSGVTFFGIGSPFWSLIFGTGVSLIAEYKDFNFKSKKARLTSAAK